MVNNYDTPLYGINHISVNKPKVTDSMKKDMRTFLNRF